MRDMLASPGERKRRVEVAQLLCDLSSYEQHAIGAANDLLVALLCDTNLSRLDHNTGVKIASLHTALAREQSQSLRVSSAYVDEDLRAKGVV